MDFISHFHDYFQENNVCFNKYELKCLTNVNEACVIAMPRRGSIVQDVTELISSIWAETYNSIE